MRKFYSFVLILTAALCSFSNSALGEELTVANGSVTEEHIPYYGFYADGSGVRVQAIYPASMLSDLAGGSITGLKFYSSAASINWSDVQVTIRLNNVTASTLPYASYRCYFNSESGSAVVYSGEFTFSGGEFSVPTEAFTYEDGKNLLLDIQAKSAASSYERTYFYGITSQEAACWTTSGIASTNGTSVNFLPKTTFTYTPAASSCAKPTGVSASSITSSGAIISWADANNTTLEYKLHSAADLPANWTVVSSTTTSSSHELIGLSPVTMYDVRVKNDCGGDGESAYTNINFTTECAEISSFPWTEGFESYAATYATGVPPCWSQLGANTNESSYPRIHVNNSSDFVQTGTNSLYIVASASQTSYIVFPEFDMPLNELQVSFAHKSENSSKSAVLTIGYMTNPSSSSSFNVIAGLDALPRSTNWTTVTQNLYNIPVDVASTARLAIRVGTATDNWYTGIDDVTVNIAPKDCTKPSATNITNKTASSAKITWGKKDGVFAYQYCVAPSGEPADWSGDLTTCYNYVTLTGLTPGDYDFYVKCVCGGDPSDAYPFTLECTAPGTPEFSLATADGGHVAWTNASGSDVTMYEYCVVASGSPADWSDPETTSSTSVDLTGLTAGNNYTFYLRSVCEGDFYSDEVSCTVSPSCPTPSGVTFSNQTYNSATVTWTAGGGETSWNLRYKAGDDGSWTDDDGAASGLTSRTYNLTGLTSGTTYTVQVQAACDGTWAEGTYTPVCPQPGTITLTNQKYDRVTVGWAKGGTEDHWRLRYKAADGDWIVKEANTASNSGHVIDGLTSGVTYTIEVTASCCAGGTARTTTYTPVCPQPGAITLTNQKYDRVTVGWAKGGTEDAWRLRYKAADGDWIVKEANTESNSGHVIDGLTSGVEYTIEVTASCCAGGSALTTTYTPSCAQPGAITLSNRTHSSVQVAWEASGTLDRWNLQYKEASAADVPANWTDVVLNTDSRSGHTISGLTTDVTYTIRVTAACCSAAPRDIEYTPICATPVSASVTNIRDVQASASWSAVSGSGITTFQYIVVARDATPDWSEATTVSATSATLTGLSVATNYDFYVRSKCADGNYSESLKRQFATTAQPPTSIVVNELDYDGLGATLSWSKSTNGAETQYQWKTSKAGSDWSEPTTTRTVHVTGLSEHTTYTFYVRSYYNETVQSSPVTRSFTTDYGLNAVPWSHDFESDATGSGQIPAGWNSKTYGSYTVYPYVVANGYSTYSYAGSKCLYFSGGSSSSQQSIILPKFNRDLKDLTISFYYNNGTTDTDYPTFEIGYYATDGNPSTAFTAIAEIPLSDGYTLAEINLQDFPTTHRRLVISYSNGDLSHSAYIDDINVFETPNCQRPVSPTCTATTNSSATLAWTENGAATAWEIEYSTHSDFSSPSTIVAAATNPFTISDLNQNTQYYARVRGVCEEEEKSDWSTTSASFRTACGSYPEYDLPYSTGFETETETGSGNIPYCWSSITYTYNDYWGVSTVYPYVTTSGGRSGNCLQFYGGVTGTSVQYVTLPLFENELKDLTLEFYQKGNSSSSCAQFTVGYFTTLGDASTFTVVKNIDRADAYTKVSVDFSSVPADMHNIAIRWGGGSSAAFGYIDDVRVTTKDNIFTGAANDGLWSSARNWTHGAVPMLSEDVVITKPVTISSATNAKAKSVILDQTDTNTGAIDIAPAGELVISGTLRKAIGTAGSKTYSPTAENDVNIGSSAAGLGGLVIGSHAAANGLNDATVNFYSQSHGSSGSTASVSQYLGIPFSNLPKMLYQFYNSWVYKFTNTGTPNWERVNGDDGLEAFAGYAVISADPVGHTYWMQGTLVASENQNISLQFNSGDGSNPDNENMLANSWMAPIQIRAFNAATDFTNADATIYIFNSGSPDDYETNNGASTTGALAGQYSAYTPGTAAATDVIPAMQAFSVYTSAADASITLDYNRLVYAPAVAGLAITPNRAPRRTGTDAYEAGEPAKMRLFVKAASGYGDMLYMLEREDFNEGFENGWDARKMFGEDVAPQLYAITPDGNMAINCVPTFEGTILGFRKGANDNGYTFTFDYDGADSWYLLDLKEQVSTLITANSTYMFVAAADDLAARFIISRTPLNDTEGVATGINDHNAQATSRKLLIDGLLYIIRNGRVYSAEGTLLK